MASTLLFGTTNEHKLEEAAHRLAALGVRLLSARDLALPAVDEDAPTFAGNAAKKACEIARATGLLTLADDSGLVVDALGGEPGVRSARYSGPGATAARNNAQLLDRLRGVPPEQRGAQFVCALALARPEGLVLAVEGRCDGVILDQPRGAGGFGYDPLFFVPERGASFAEMPPADKDRYGHRGRALDAFAAAFARWLSGGGAPD